MVKLTSRYFFSFLFFFGYDQLKLLTVKICFVFFLRKSVTFTEDAREKRIKTRNRGIFQEYQSLANGKRILPLCQQNVYRYAREDVCEIAREICCGKKEIFL